MWLSGTRSVAEDASVPVSLAPAARWAKSSAPSPRPGACRGAAKTFVSPGTVPCRVIRHMTWSRSTVGPMTVRRRTALASLGAGAGVWAGLLRPTPAQAVGTAPWPDVFFLDNYGADPTGVTLSDNAWINAYSAAVNAIVTGNGTAGALVAAGFEA